MNEHRHAIIVIKNEKGEYLQYFEEKWNSFLFLNCKVIDEYDISKVTEYVSQKFNISTDKIKVKYIMNKLHTKFSQKDKVDKLYRHYFFDVSIEGVMIEDNAKNFKWFSLEELENDKRIQEVNSDVVSFIKEM